MGAARDRDDRDDRDEKKTNTFLKTIMGSIAGMIGGAILMYLNNFVTGAIKPAKPVPNFSFQATGLTLQFQNRSTGGTSGWWDFGDGSALEPFDPKQPAITHTFPNFGSYNVRLTLYNLLGEETDRTVSVNLDARNASPPVIEDFQVISASNDPQPAAPATFRVYAKVKNAELLLWTLGTERPAEIATDGVGGVHDRMITLKEYGWHTIRLVAVSGKQVSEQTKTVFVGVPSERPAPGAALQVAYDAVQVERKSQNFNLPIIMPANQSGSSWRFEEERAVPAGWRIGDLKAKPAPPNLVRNAELALSPDRTRFLVKGEMIRSSGMFGSRGQPQWLAEVAATLEKTSEPTIKTSDPIFVPLKLPGRTMLAMPAASARLAGDLASS
ncbi:MAG: PKD domain-containing protein [Gemmataceae bacterium]